MDNKLAQNAEIQAKIIGTNILHCHWASEKKPAKLISYESKTRIVVISLGLYDGLISFGSFSISGIIPALLKEAIEWKTLIRYWIWNEKYVPSRKKKICASFFLPL